MQVARLIRTIRITHNLSQQDLAEKLGVTRNHISYLESGQRLPSLKFLSTLADEFDYNIFWLKRVWVADKVSQMEENLKRLAELD
jgi:transcriptional regulator with XRE-family HTH domain